MMSAGECPFCPAKDVEAFCSDALFLALHNVSPILPGHSLILPRAHVESVLDLANGELGAFVLFARRVTRLLTCAFRADGFDWSIQDGVAAGQTVRHLHLHVIPRHAGDLPDPGDWYPALRASESAPIDSPSRPRLSPADHARLTAHLRGLCERQR
jgi:bis(5'-adenosyl)-triphosphatase